MQNSILIGDYQRRIAAGDLASGKGRAFASEDRLRAAVIERIMCDYQVDLDAVCGAFQADPARLASGAPGLDELVRDQLVRREGNLFTMEDHARPLVRVLAAAFDEYLGHAPARHSRAV